MSCVLNVLFGGTKQRKAYAVAYALLTRVQILLTHLKVPYADLTLTNFNTSPQFGLTRSNFYMQESKQWVAKSSRRWRRGTRGRRWWRSTTSRSSQSAKLTTFFDSKSEGFSHRSAQVTKRSDKLTTLTTTTRKARQDRLTSGEDFVQQEVGFI